MGDEAVINQKVYKTVTSSQGSSVYNLQYQLCNIERQLNHINMINEMENLIALCRMKCSVKTEEPKIMLISCYWR